MRWREIVKRITWYIVKFQQDTRSWWWWWPRIIQFMFPDLFVFVDNSSICCWRRDIHKLLLFPFPACTCFDVPVGLSLCRTKVRNDFSPLLYISLRNLFKNGLTMHRLHNVCTRLHFIDLSSFLTSVQSIRYYVQDASALPLHVRNLLSPANRFVCICILCI